MMHPFNVTGDRLVDLSLLFGLMTLVAGFLAWLIYLVFARAIRQEEDDDQDRDPR